MGIKTPLNETPAVSLGASDVSLLELVNAYGTVINDGMVHDPVMVTRIEDKNGKIIYRHKQEQKQALPYETAFLMTQMLMAGLTEPMGTSQALWGYDLFRYNTDFGGKTGTSSNHSDAWFVGVTPNLADDSLSKYRARFPNPKQTISRSYQCRTPYPPIEPDSMDMETDSIAVSTDRYINKDSLVSEK